MPPDDFPFLIAGDRAQVGCLFSDCGDLLGVAREARLARNQLAAVLTNGVLLSSAEVIDIAGRDIFFAKFVEKLCNALGTAKEISGEALVGLIVGGHVREPLWTVHAGLKNFQGVNL
jgi:hypothetical protein